MGMFLRRGYAPTKTPLGELSLGTIVKLNESGAPIEFYVAKHNYEQGLNGVGRTLLVRKDIHSLQHYDSSKYSLTALDSFLRNTWVNLLDSHVRELAGTTKIYSPEGGGGSSLEKIYRAAFILSSTELGVSGSGMVTVGTALPTATLLKQQAFLNGSSTSMGMRTADDYSSSYTYSCHWARGQISASKIYIDSDTIVGCRPCITIPAETILSKDLLIA